MARGKSKKSWVLITVSTLVGLGLVLTTGVFIWWQTITRAVSLENTQTQKFIIAKGSGVNQIASKLKAENLIKSELAFKLMVKKLGIDTQIQAGSFELSPGQNTQEIATTLTKGSDDVWITILEGWRREEAATAISEALNAKGIDFDAQTFLDATQDKEGYLFPDTYLIPLTISEASLANLLTNTFDQKITDQMKQDIDQSGKTLAQIITMASLIEREARTDEARKMVSGILWKRLENDWPLQVDATLQYVSGFNKTQNDWWPDPTVAMKEIDSPYNTYKFTGLPPSPIASPSLSSIMAAIYPSSSEFWYYISDLQGRMHYGRTLDDHNLNVEKYLR